MRNECSLPHRMGEGQGEGPSECNGGVKTHHTSSMSVETVDVTFQKPSSRPSPVKREKEDPQTRGCGVRRDTDLGRNLDQCVTNVPSPIGWGRVRVRAHVSATVT